MKVTGRFLVLLVLLSSGIERSSAQDVPYRQLIQLEKVCRVMSQEGEQSKPAVRIQVQQAGYYRLFPRIWYDSGDEQKNESFYLTVRSQSGDMLTPQDANAGPYKVVADIPGLPQDPWEGPVDSSVTVLWRDAGRFYLPEGEHFIYMNHYARIVTEYPQFLQDSLGPTESVRLLDVIRLQYEPPIDAAIELKVTAPHQFIYQDSPAEYAMPGDAFSGILMVENAGQNTIYSSTLVFDYPVFLKLSTDTDFEYQDSDSLDTARRSWDLPEMASGASLWIQFSAQVPDTMRAAIVPVHFLGRIEAAHDVDITNNRAERDQNIYAISPQFDPPTDLKIELNALTDDRIMAPAAPVTRIAPGDSFEYQINVSNLGPSDADTFDVALNLPPSIHILSFDVPDSVIRLSKGVWRYPGLVPTSTLESLIRVQVDDTVTVESLNAMAKVGYSADVDTSNNTDSARVFITPPPKTADLSMHIDLDVDTSLIVDDEIIPAVVYPDSLMYRLMVHNAGPDTALNIVLSHTLPPEMQFLSSERGPETLDETDFNWTIGEIPPNDSLSILITIQPDEMSVFPVVLEMSALAQADRDTLPDNNVMIQDFAVLESRPAEMKTADLSTHMEFDTDTSFVVDDQTIPAVVYPDSLNYRLMVYNAGPDTAVDCMIIHSLPPEMQFVYADAEPEISNAGTLSWEVPGIAPGDSHAIAMIIKPGDIDDYPLQLEMSILAKADRDTLLQNNQLARSFAILEPQKPDDMLSDLNLDILMNPDTVYRKDGTDYPAFFYPDSVDYHLHIVNHGPDTAGLFDLTHRFPGVFEAVEQTGFVSDSVYNRTFAELPPGDSVMISMVIRLTMLPEFPFQGELTALVNSDSDSLLANNTVEQMFFVLQRPGPLLNTDITVNQIVHLDSSAVSADIPTFYYEPEQQVRFDVNVINKEQVPAENVTLVNVIPEHFVFVSADPEPDQVSLDSLFWMFSEVLTQESIELILKAPEAHEPEPLMGMNKGRVSASNEDSASLDDNVTSVKLIQIIREIEPFTPEIQVTPRIADVSDSLVVQVRFPVEISTWDLWIYLPDGEIVTDFADWYIETQSILPDQWYTVDEVYRHSELHNKSQDELVFKLTATSVTGAQGTAGDQVLVRSGDKLSIDRNVYQPDLEEPIIIRFKIKLSGRVELDLWDISGDHVTRVLDQILSAGWHDLSWNGTTETGKRIGSGVYLLTIRTAGENNYKKLIIVR